MWPLFCVQMSDVGLLIFDEAHHCKADHPYNQLMQVSTLFFVSYFLYSFFLSFTYFSFLIVFLL